MTPEKARELLAYGEDGIFEKPIGMIATIAVDSTQTIAGQHYEYAVEVQPVPGGVWHQVTKWTPDPSPVLPVGRELEHDERIVRRLAGNPEVVTE